MWRAGEPAHKRDWERGWSRERLTAGSETGRFVLACSIPVCEGVCVFQLLVTVLAIPRYNGGAAGPGPCVVHGYTVCIVLVAFHGGRSVHTERLDRAGMQQHSISSGMCKQLYSGLCCVSASVAWRVVHSRGARSVPSAHRQSQCAAGRHRSRVAVCANQCRCAIVCVSSWHVLQPSARSADKFGSSRACVNGGLRAGTESVAGRAY